MLRSGMKRRSKLLSPHDGTRQGRERDEGDGKRGRPNSERGEKGNGGAGYRLI